MTVVEPHESYEPIRRPDAAQVHCQYLGVLSTACWGAVALYETRDPLHGRVARARCQGHARARYLPLPSGTLRGRP